MQKFLAAKVPLHRITRYRIDGHYAFLKMEKGWKKALHIAYMEVL